MRAASSSDRLEPETCLSRRVSLLPFGGRAAGWFYEIWEERVDVSKTRDSVPMLSEYRQLYLPVDEMEEAVRCTD